MSIAGKYETISTDNYEEYLKDVGVSLINRNLAAKTKATVEWIQNGDQWTQKTYTLVKNFEITFTPGVEFDEATADGRKVQAVITIEGNKLIHKQKSGDMTATTVREFNGDEMVSTFTGPTVKAVRKYKKIA